MKKQTIKKIISSLIIFIFIVSLLQNTTTVNAASYSNPNQGSSDTYKFKIKDIVNSNLLTSVVGCTGVVNKVASWMARFVQSPLKVGEIAKDEIAKKRKQLEDACSTVKSAAQAAGNLIPMMGGLSDSINTSLETKKLCQSRVKMMSDDMISKMMDEEKATQARDFKEQCFDGIAITLAKNQLTAMTRSAMNWVNSGYGGNPFFVQNMRSLTTKLEQNVIETGVDVLLNPGSENPYARDFARTTINSRGIVSSSAGLLGNLTSDLENFVTDPTSYYTNDQLSGAQNTEIALQKARGANDAFARDFSVGGWNGWLALTQREKNNPLGFNMLASQYLADIQAQKVSDIKTEITENNGFMSQKQCTKWQEYNEDGTPKTKKVAGTGGLNGLAAMYESVYKTSRPSVCYKAGGDCCVDWKVTTPGSLIKDKVTNYLNSPERQLELVKTINDSLNALFSVLISKLEGGGLSGLSDSAVSVNWADSLNSLDSNSADGSSGDSGYNNNGAYDNFNLTRDLGNTYIHDNTEGPAGTWDAELNLTNTFEWKDVDGVNTKTNTKIKLYSDIAPTVYDNNGNITVSKYTYYTVTNPGKTKLLSSGYNDWEKGDRAFWDGEKWQNWKLGQQSPIKNRGVIQIQQDYIVAAKEMLKVLPGIMPALGELDYCLPGPNPNYKINSSNYQTTFNDWIGSAYVGPVDTSGERFGVDIDNEGDSTFNAFRSSYQNNNIWNNIISEKWGTIKYNNETADLSFPNVVKIFSNICNDKTSESLSSDVNGYSTRSGTFYHSDAYNCTGNYTYAKNGGLGSTQANNLDFKTKVKEYISNYTGSYLFDKFYETFDQKMNSLYFKKMTNRYIEYENQPVAQLNPAYIKMAESGFDFTKNIVSYSEDTVKAQADYANAITQAKVNIAKLEPIKEAVSAIIKEAQDARDAKLVAKLAQEGIKTTVAQLRIDYKSCFDEENIKVFDVESIVGSNEKRSQEACSDGVDNDLDGLIDSKDPDCGATTTIVAPRDRTNVSSEASSTSNNTPTISYRCEVGDQELSGTTLGSMKRGCDAVSQSTCMGRYEEGYTSAGSPANYKCQWVSY